MGKSRTPALIVEFQTSGGTLTNHEWRIGKRGQLVGYGKPTEENLRKYVLHLLTSMAPGGCNDHIPKIAILGAKIRRNEPFGGVVAAIEMSDHSVGV